MNKNEDGYGLIAIILFVGIFMVLGYVIISSLLESPSGQQLQEDFQGQPVDPDNPPSTLDQVRDSASASITYKIANNKLSMR